MSELDKIDLRLLEMLQLDARKSVKAMALEVGLTSTPVYERIKKLEQQGYIKRYGINLDLDKIGLGLTVFCQVILKTHSKTLIRNFEHSLQSISEVAEVYHTSGEYDYLLKVICEDNHAYHRFIIDKLSALDMVSKVQSNFVLSELKSFEHIPLLRT